MAVDWSGAKTGAHRHLWLAECDASGATTRLTPCRSRDEVWDELLGLAEDDADLVVGLDFSFSFPAWFGARLGSDIDEVWDATAEHGEGWLAECPEPFWGRPARPCRVPADLRLRRTEGEIAARTGLRPSSTLQIGGAGSVGTGSIRGMPGLQRLRRVGFSVWPFDAASGPLLVELWPRVAIGRTVKSSAAERALSMAALEADESLLSPEVVALAIASADAFDALHAARFLHATRASLIGCARTNDPTIALEGWMWSGTEGVRRTAR